MSGEKVLAVVARAAAAALVLWASSSAAGDVEVLNDETPWRFQMAYRPPAVGTARAWKETKREANPWVRSGEHLAGPMPPDDWTGVEFDDSCWPRQIGPILGGCGEGRPTGAALIWVRGRFGVTDPSRVKGLRIRLAYRGGAVVYVNGRQVAVGHLPKRGLEPTTPAEDYPAMAFVTPDGRAQLPDFGKREPPADLLPRYRSRIRMLSADISNDFLRPGVNVLGIELHRTTTPPGLPDPNRSLNWDTVGLVGVRLTAGGGGAVRPNTRPPSAAHAWNADPLFLVGNDVTHGDAYEPLRPLRLVAPRNGFASGQIVVSGPGPMRGVSATVTDLEVESGGVIPAFACSVRYAQPGDRFVPLTDRPDASSPMQPVWLTVSVPPAAKPGLYEGTLTIKGPFRPVTVPVELTVLALGIGDPSAWQTWVNLLESPESVAGRYGVALWSERHFGLMAKSFALMERAGNDCLGVGAVGNSVFGNDPAIVFRRQGSGHEPDFEFLERYLGLYDKVAGAPRMLSVHVWNYGMYYRGFGRDGGKAEQRAETMPIVERRGDRLVNVDVPIYGQAGTAPLWKQVMDGVGSRLAKLGWDKTRVVLGTSGDTWPSGETVKFFKQVAPGVGWRVLTHGCGAPSYGGAGAQLEQPNGMVIGYLEIARRIRNNRSKVEGVPVACNARDCVGSDPFQYRSLPVVNVVGANFDGICWKGIDYWSHAGRDGKERGALNTYVHFGNMVGGTPRAMAWPGPDGAVATVQYEMLRAGIQDAEVMLYLRGALGDWRRRQRIENGVAERAQAAMRDLEAVLETGARFHPQGGADVQYHLRRVYEAAGEVAKALGET